MSKYLPLKTLSIITNHIPILLTILFLSLSSPFYPLYGQKITLPYERERIEFNIEWRGIKVANTEFRYEKMDNEHLITISANSGLLGNLIGYTFENVYQIITDDNLLPITYIKDINQSKITEKSQINYDYVDLTATYHDTIADTFLVYAIESDTRDFFSGLYYLRTCDLKRSITFTVDNAWKLSTITTKYLQSETIRTGIGRVKTNKVEVTFLQHDKTRRRYSDILTNNLVRDENKLYFWFTDDVRQIPVKAQFIGRQNVNWVIKEYQR